MDDINIYHNSLVSNFENTIDLSFEVLPNPSNGIFQLIINNDFENNEFYYDVVNLAGQIVIQKNTITSKNTTVNLTEKPSGIYFVRLNNDTLTSFIKLIKQ